MERKHDYDADIMRIAASFFVVLIHSVNISSFSGAVYNVIAHFSVPVFFLISGYYLLDRVQSAVSVFKRCLRLFAIMLCWSSVYYIYGRLNGTASSGLREVAAYLLTKPDHFWFIWTELALYLFTPVLSVFSRNADRREYLYALSLSFFLGCIVFILLRSQSFPLLGSVVDRAKVPYTLGMIFVYLFGGYVKRFGVRHRALIYASGILSLVYGLIAVRFLPESVAISLVLSFLAPNTVLSGIAFFVFVKSACEKRPITSPRLQRLLYSLSSCTAGIYFIHPLIIDLIKKLDLSFLPGFLIGPAVAAAAFAASLLVTAALKKLPLTGRICI